MGQIPRSTERISSFYARKQLLLSARLSHRVLTMLTVIPRDGLGAPASSNCLIATRLEVESMTSRSQNQHPPYTAKPLLYGVTKLVVKVYTHRCGPCHCSRSRTCRCLGLWLRNSYQAASRSSNRLHTQNTTMSSTVYRQNLD